MRTAKARLSGPETIGCLRWSALFMASVVVTGCSGPLPRLPDMSLTMPKIELANFGIGTKAERILPAAPYTLSPSEMRGLQSAVRAAFPTDWNVTFLSGNAGRLSDGTIAACGLVTARGQTNESARSYLYRAGQDDVSVARGTGRFELRQIASKRGEQISIYSNCSAMRLM